MTKFYTAIQHIDRGRSVAPVKPGELFPFTGDELDHLLANNAIREATDDEIALAKGRAKGSLSKAGPVDVSDVDDDDDTDTVIQDKLHAADREAAGILSDAEKAAQQKIADAEAAAEKLIEEAKQKAAEIAKASATETSTENSGDGATGTGEEAPKSKAKAKSAKKSDDGDLEV